ncbi:Peptidoglycan glycosyltransferase MrdB [subsurface metagenome]
MGTKTKPKIWLLVLIFLLLMVLILVGPDLGTVMLMMPILFTMLFVAGAKVKHLLIMVLMAPIFLLLMILILVEPALGTVMLMMSILFIMLFVAGVKVKHLLIILLMALAVSPLLWHKWHKTKPYQRTRISSTPRANKRPGVPSPNQRTRISSTPGANKGPPAVPSPISSNEYEFGLKTSLSHSARSKKEFCDMVRDPVQFKRVIASKKNRLSFKSRGAGFFNSGVCWWHSRLTRSATYLTVYRPDLPKPTKKQVLKIFDAYFHNSRVVEIPGYENLREFSSDWEDLLLKKLEDWQKVDGIFGFAWVGGLAGKTEVSPEELKDKMDNLFKEVRTENKIVYQKLQQPGIRAHSWLVFDMKKTSDGYVLRTTNSSSSNMKVAHYKIGDQYFRHRFGIISYYTFVPYTEFENELKKIRAAQERYCRSN